MAMALDEVDLILKHRFADKACEYLVQWSGDLARTWEPSSNLTECQTFLRSYWREFSSSARNFEFLTPSFTLVEEQVFEEEEEAEEEAESKPVPKKRTVATKRRPARAAEDKIAVAKRVQMNKQLVDARTRAGASSSSTKSPPPTAKRSVAMDFDDDFDDTEPPVAPAETAGVHRAGPGRQVARKSTGDMEEAVRTGRPLEDSDEEAQRKRPRAATCSAESYGLLTPLDTPADHSDSAAISAELKRRIEACRLQAPEVTTPASPAGTTSSRPKNYVCPECNKAFTRPCRLDEHERTHTGSRPFVCMYPGCTKAYMRDSHLSAHSRSHDPNRKYQCPQCDKGFNLNQHLKRHLETHLVLKPHKCTFEGCTEAFAKRNQLHLHMCKHTNENPYACDECESSFKHPSQLKRHKRTHCEDTRYVCGAEGCLAKFAKWSELQAHKRDDHTKTEVHTCELCQATFKRRHGLTLHLLRHDPDRLVYPCTIDGCTRFYLDKNALRAHTMTVHAEDARFKCTHEGCDKSYAYAKSLRNHVSKVHEAPPPATENVATVPRISRREARRRPTELEVASGMAYADPEVSGRLMQCTISGCLFRFKRQAELDLHLAAIHNDTTYLNS
ncbi:Strongly-conserved Zn-finger binding protein (TFIIIA) [Coemansia sp. S146]|nr:Strongly-conserved Zn-finger binding protein (TFIIIA) [Coemansia sp. S146]